MGMRTITCGCGRVFKGHHAAKRCPACKEKEMESIETLRRSYLRHKRCIRCGMDEWATPATSKDKICPACREG